MARVLIAGCGYVGAALGEILLQDSHDVWGLRRKPRTLPAGIEPIEADLSQPRSLAVLPDDLDVVEDLRPEPRLVAVHNDRGEEARVHHLEEVVVFQALIEVRLSRQQQPVELVTISLPKEKAAISCRSRSGNVDQIGGSVYAMPLSLLTRMPNIFTLFRCKHIANRPSSSTSAGTGSKEDESPFMRPSDSPAREEAA